MKFLQRWLLAVGIIGSICAFPIYADAAERATVTANVTLRSGPGSKFQSIGTVQAGDLVLVYSCRSGFDWCNVSHRGTRGYLAARYLSYAIQGEYYGEPFSSVGLYLGVPIFWDDYPIYRPPGHRPPDRPPGWKPPGDRPPNWRPPGQRPPGVRPPSNRPSHPIYRPPSFQRPSTGMGGGRGGGFGGGGRGGGGGGRR